MKKSPYVLLILTVILLMSFSVMKRLDFSVRFKNIDEKDNSLKLEFKINYPESKMKTYSGSTIDILKADSLYLRLVADSIKNTTILWNFPSIPVGYRIVYPESTKNFPDFNKIDRVKFIFSSLGVYYGEWEYKPYYSNKNSRWLFDEFGNQICTIESIYEAWLFGKDIIKIETDKELFIEELRVQILNEEGRDLEFEIKYKKNPTDIITLKLKEKEKKGNKLKLILHFNKDKRYEEEIIVPNRNIVGIFGKYNDL